MSPQSDMDVQDNGKPTLTPPASDEADKHGDSGSELSDLDAEPEENGEILPDHYYDGGKIPVFKPVRDPIAVLVWRPWSVLCLRTPYSAQCGLIPVVCT